MLALKHVLLLQQPKFQSKTKVRIPFACNFYLLAIDFQSGLIQYLDGSLENSMSRIILEHVSLRKINENQHITTIPSL